MGGLLTQLYHLRAAVCGGVVMDCIIFEGVCNISHACKCGRKKKVHHKLGLIYTKRSFSIAQLLHFIALYYVLYSSFSGSVSSFQWEFLCCLFLCVIFILQLNWNSSRIKTHISPPPPKCN